MTINCKGKLLDFQIPKVMGILNVTPNSFFDGGKFADIDSILAHTSEMIDEGAAIIDVGGYSSKPNADVVSEEEEINRVVPVVKEILRNFPEVILSIDTFRGNVARICVENGAALINDISAGLLDPQMIPIVASLKVPFIMMHMRGTSQNMQKLTQYENVVSELILYFSERITAARDAGISDLIIDPGFGFAKTTDQNYEILNKLELFSIADVPLLAGISRKSMVYKPLKSSAKEALNGTSVLNTIALTKGAKILRVHDVREAVECVTLYQKMISVPDY